MSIITRYSIYVTSAAVLALIISRALTDDSRSAFFSNFFLNLVAEFLGWAVGGVLAAVVASRLAAKKLADFAPDLVRLIAELRKGKTISEKAARQGVICAVGLLSENSLREARTINKSILITEVKCLVCDLNAETDRNPDGNRRCPHCHLTGDVWDREQLAPSPPRP